MWHVWDTGEVYTEFWWESLSEGGLLENLGVRGKVILIWIFRQLEGVVGTGWSWLRIGTDGRHLWVW
jgi:hypothetical protein